MGPRELGFVGPARSYAAVAVLVALSAAFLGCNSLVGAPAAGQVGINPEASTGDATGGTGDAPGLPSCVPGSVQSFVPSAYRPAQPEGQGVCGTDAIGAYYVNCLGAAASKPNCDAFIEDPANAACVACIVSAAASSTYGPLVLTNGFVEANVAGCLELEAPTALMCAKAQQALTDCELAACADNCPVADEKSLMAYQQCAAQADATGCNGYYTRAWQCIEGLADASAAGTDAGLASICLSGFDAFYDNVVPLFCGPPQNPGPDGAVSPDDGGSDGGDAAPEAGAPLDAAGAGGEGGSADGGAPSDAGADVGVAVGSEAGGADGGGGREAGVDGADDAPGDASPARGADADADAM